MKIMIRSTEDKGEGRELGKSGEHHQEVLAVEVVECSPGKASLKASVALCWSRLSLESRAGDSGVPCREECSLGKLFSRSTQQIPAAPAIQMLSRNMKACYRWADMWWPQRPRSGRRRPWGWRRWSEEEVETAAVQLGSCWSSSACSPKSTLHCCPQSENGREKSHCLRSKKIIHSSHATLPITLSSQ